MNKAERLFNLVNLLHGRRTALTAQQMAEQMQVSVRTIYRDIQALVAAGVQIEGDAGVGYLLRPHSHLPPLMFSADEALALLLGSQMVRAFTEPQLAAAAQLAEQKIRAILPPSLQRQAEQQVYRIPVTEKDQPLRERHGLIRWACEQHFKINLSYSDHAGQASHRIIWPLGIIGLHGTWLLLAWCELRQDYRMFRFDRIIELSICEQTFQTAKGLNLQHYLSNILGIQN
ncbi:MULTISPECIES: helix-turn-helix transcriptional regulator [Deefgea]|uniref:WYL domain-containing protein n=1 Tax=Deefgea chitinilytica TaxID=570276 RepID=A0ABS2CAT1_9NEIS|nr:MULTISPECIES: YafY family protein [Deefgea]MBM5571132.1 WYL domain-containing protein [Deefgea chitinilytica]MBM9888362.1 YafY family transcriptional regulator [Deefgea sp. CFH1-16]